MKGKTTSEFEAQYKKLNPAQKKAVDAIDGPVMVIAGPGTGKTTILALRIANILHGDTQTAPDAVLALTFTNSGVRAMRDKLADVIGPAASRVAISTFHSFSASLIQEFYRELSLEEPPKLLDERDKVLLFDEILEQHDWERLRTRNGGEGNFRDLKSLISLLKQEQMKVPEFLSLIDAEQKRIKENPASRSSRGPTKGEMKVSEKEKIERLERTKEAGRFYELYEKTKKERGLMDYDDVLEYAVELVRRFDDVRDTLRERYLYVLVDEHQDSSGVQNRFLEAIWGGVEKANVFAVGDDRQLIYGFGGASLSHFENFQEVFAGTRVIALSQNYRSTQKILDAAGALLSSSIVKEGLTGGSKELQPIQLVEAEYPRDEILRAGLMIQERVAAGLSPDLCAILVPKRSQVKSAVLVLKDLGLPVASGKNVSFFSAPETQSLLAFLRALVSPCDSARLCELLLDPTFSVPFLTAQKFLKTYGRRLSISMFEKGDHAIKRLGRLIEDFLKDVSEKDVYALVQKAGAALFFENSQSHKDLLVRIEVVRTALHLALSLMEKNPKTTLGSFLGTLDRLERYDADVPLAVFSGDTGVKVMTLHASKGLEFDFVWIAHLDEASLMKGRELKIVLPEALKEKVSKKDELTAKRELYVGLTRARRFATFSYARNSYSGADQKLAQIVSDMPQEIFLKQSAEETEREIRAKNPLAYVVSAPRREEENIRKEIAELVRERYAKRAVSVTQLNNFFGCPWRWYFRSFLELPEPETASLKFGSLVHACIEKVIRNGSVSKKKMAEIIEESLDKLFVFDERERARFAKDAEVLTGRFAIDFLPGFLGADSEKKIKPYRDPELPEIEIGGKIDAVKTLPDGSLEVTDFKTGKVKTRGEIEKRTSDNRLSDSLRQLAMYVYLLGNEKNAPKVSSARLLFLEARKGDKNVLYAKSVGEEEVALLRKDLRHYVNLLSSGEWMDLPCNFKSYGRQKECEYCAIRRRFF